MKNAIDGWVSTFKKYAVVQGRATRTEYWMWVLLNIAALFALGLVEGMVGMFPNTDESVLGSIFSLVILVPSICVAVRRLHDTGKTGWLMLLMFLPLVGAIILIIFFCQDSQPGENQYGPNPKVLPAAV